jgi:NTP pyrophosphatase (non-canonical NTP hydrolase)
MLEEWRNKNEDELQLEYADVLIRLVDMADVFGIDLLAAYRRKMDKNWKRPYQHGGKTL